MYKSFCNGSVMGVTSWIVEGGHLTGKSSPYPTPFPSEDSLISIATLLDPSRLPTFQLPEPTLL
jgi:hypothetical protein